MRDIEKIIITGGAGFIGSAFLRLALSGMAFPSLKKIVCIDSLTYAGDKSIAEKYKTDSRFEFVKEDILNANSVLDKYRNYDILINFAAESHVDRSIEDARPFLQTNILGTFELLDYFNNSNISIFLQISTDEVYGSLHSGSATEKTPLKPSSQYSSSKASADLMVQANHETFGRDYIITRCTNNFGPNQNNEKFIPTVITNLLLGGMVPIYGTGQNIRDWMYVDDHIFALEKILLAGELNTIYNISSYNEFSNIEMVAKISHIIWGKDSRDSIEFIADRKGHDFRYSLSSRKLRDSLYWKPRDTLDNNLVQTVAWYEDKLKLSKKI